MLDITLQFQATFQNVIIIFPSHTEQLPGQTAAHHRGRVLQSDGNEAHRKRRVPDPRPLHTKDSAGQCKKFTTLHSLGSIRDLILGRQCTQH